MTADDQPQVPPTLPSATAAQPQVAAAANKLFASRPEAMSTVGLAVNFGGNPLLDKLTPEHLSRSVDLAASKEQHDFELKKLEAEQKRLDASNQHKQAGSDRRFEVFGIIMLVGLIVFIIAVFRDKPTVLVPTLTLIVGGIGGFFSGAGYSKLKQGKSA